MDYKENYINAFNRAKKLKETCDNQAVVGWCEYIFPELVENKDEKIRKQILDCFKTMKQQGCFPSKYKEQYDSWIAWLEKQKSVDETVKKCKDSWYNEGKIAGQAEGLTDNERYWQGWHDALEKQSEAFSDINTPSRELIFSIWDLGNQWKEITKGRISAEHGTQLKYIQKHWKESEYYLKRNQDESEDSEELKFHVGDWIIANNKKSTYQVVEVKRGIYVVRDNADNHEYHIGIEECEKSGRLWNISDAKDGDVLVASDDSVFIYAGSTDRHAKFYVALTKWGTFNLEGGNWEDKNRVHPATKEQRELLFKKMAKSGYEWDSEKKELKKIEQNPTDKFKQNFKVGDWIINNISKDDVFLIKSINNGYYTLEDIKGNIISPCLPPRESESHLWTIKDAKDGDILYFYGSKAGNYRDSIFIFDGLDKWRFDEPNGERAIPTGYCCITFLRNNFLKFDCSGPDLVELDFVKPATKKQRDILFTNLEEAGYEWDAENNILKK